MSKVIWSRTTAKYIDVKNVDAAKNIVALKGEIEQSMLGTRGLRSEL